MNRKALPLSQVYRLLEPGPVAMVSTAHAGRLNVMTMSWLTMMEFEPPLLGCVIGSLNYSFGLLQKSRECVINIPTVEIARQMAGCGSCSGRRVDKFEQFGLTPLPAARVAAPLIAECYANLECRIADARLVRKYNFFVLLVLRAWIDPARKRPRLIFYRGDGEYMLAGRAFAVPS